MEQINKENRTVTFAGGIPNGYCGRVNGDPKLTNIITYNQKHVKMQHKVICVLID